MADEPAYQGAIPDHVAIIMDGNGRWAKKRHRPRSFGHRAGVEAVRRIVEDAADIGIECLTLYSFSTENWTRPRAEIAALMTLMSEYIENDLARLKREGVKIRVLGGRTGLSPNVLALIDKAVSETSQNERFKLNIAFNYGGRDEILRAMRKASASDVDLQSMTESDFSRYLDTAGLPDPDLVIRTSGERRISNYLLWQAAYAEYVFMDVLWPDFGRDELIAALDEYTSRDRRFGAAQETEVA
ncbi:isoprenyl transferase [uncultured Algimonas sp.]|uniref:isoprenyl transferase n=1 Tax=uncultured Algimonas sp. TaxID=1547920 RepID=UPI002619202B|nr:isoprenyl transferase [uncultured Algimonas sp.]